jgi:hypothetical protein
MCRFVPQVVSHLRLFHLCPHPSSPSTGANDIRRKLLSPLEFLRLCEFEDGSNREQMVRTACCISNNLHT